MVYDEDKLTEMVLYAAQRLEDDQAGGATKLNKVLFFAEFTHLREFGRAISGCEFQKLDHGPAPRRMIPVRDRLTQAGDAELLEEDYHGRTQLRLIALRQADVSVFSENELVTINGVLDRLEGMNATQVSDMSHCEPGWQLTEPGETIPYSTAFLATQHVDTPTSRRLTNEVAERYGVATK